jgi:hypothetical protein
MKAYYKTITEGDNDQCHCKPDNYFPVCGSNQVTYHSPCYAGCLDTKRNGRVIIILNNPFLCVSKDSLTNY